MRREEFTPDIAKKVLELWGKHLGFFDTRYVDNPEFLADVVQDPHSWFGRDFEDRIGSRYTDDSKLEMQMGPGGLEITCYVQAHTVMGEERTQEAKKAEEDFNRAMKAYLESLSKTPQ